MINEYDYENTKAYQNLGTALVCALQLLVFLQSYLFFIREIAKFYIIAHPNFGLTWLAMRNTAVQSSLLTQLCYL